MNTAQCPICEEKIKLEKKIKFLERVTCPTCEALLEVVNTSPIELDWIYYDEHYGSNGRERSKSSNNTGCPLCRDIIHIGSSQMKVGNRIICPGCDAQLEIVSLMPLELDWPYDGGFDHYFQDDDSIEENLDDYLN
jgi:Zn-finger nucleic acid-binding protein